MTHISHVHRPRYRFHISYCFRVIEDGIIPKNFWSGTYRGCIFIVSPICCTASWLDRPGLHPKLVGSNCASHAGSNASLTSACVARACMIGMPRGRCSGLPDLSIQTLRTGFAGVCRSMCEIRCSLCGGVRLFALQDVARSFWSLRAFWVSPRVVA